MIIGASGFCAKTISESTTVFRPFMTTMLVSVYDNTTVNYNTTTVRLVDSTNTGPLLCDLDTVCESQRLNSPTVLSTGEALAPTMLIWASSNLSAFPSDYASSLAAALKIPFGSQATTSPSSSPTSIPSNTCSPDPGLSHGAQAGIGVGVGATVIVSVSALLYLLRRRRRQHQQRVAHPALAEMEGSSNGLKRFIGGKWRAEQDGTSQPVEAESRSVRVIPGPHAGGGER
jgi:hypothetical protein